jgi:hydroxymethylpyrimidine pyrophosphatase-like HAD family hydrolase
MPDTAFVGITAAGVSKGSAMRILAAQYGVDMRDVMYVGDADNDLSALQVAGHPIAMANASAAALRAASRTVGHVDEGGLAEALEIAIADAGQ